MRKAKPKISEKLPLPETVAGVLEEIEQAFPSPRLTLELLPATTWGSNLRSVLRQSQWNKLRFPVYEAANRRCEVCGGVGRQYPVACHERWEFDDAQRCQRLIGLIALCPDCHAVKHFGRENEHGRGPDAMLHLCDVNDWSFEKADRYIRLVFQLWKLRSNKPWHLDLTWLEPFGINRL